VLFVGTPKILPLLVPAPHGESKNFAFQADWLLIQSVRSRTWPASPWC